jgi:RimJ/RimL family protein N-acetyltransferase
VEQVRRCSTSRTDRRNGLTLVTACLEPAEQAKQWSSTLIPFWGFAAAVAPWLGLMILGLCERSASQVRAKAASRRASFARPGRGRGVKQFHRLTPRDRAGCLRCATGRSQTAGHPRVAEGPGRVAPAAGGQLRVVGPEALPAGGRGLIPIATTFVPYIPTVPLLATPALQPGTMAALTQPEITANGIVLRPWQAPDRLVVVAAFADPAIQRWHCRSMTDQEAADWIDSWPARWRTESGASWAVLAADAVVGQVGLRSIDLVQGSAAVSYWVLPQARGRRVARRALAALTNWSFETLGLHRLGLSHSVANQGSCHVAQHAGFTAEGTKRGEGRHADGWHDMHLHARLSIDV